MLRLSLCVALAGSAAASLRLTISADGAAAAGSHTGTVVNARSAFHHVFQNVLGLGGHHHLDLALPVTALLHRPAVGLLVAVEGFPDELTVLQGSPSWELDAGKEGETRVLHYAARAFSGTWLGKHSGAASSVDWRMAIGAAGLRAKPMGMMAGGHVPHAGHHANHGKWQSSASHVGQTLSWVAGTGFSSNASSAAAVAAPLSGVLACQPSGEGALMSLGLTRLGASGKGACGTWQLGGEGAVLDASVAPVQQALSEAAALVLGTQSQPPAPKGDARLALFSAYLSGVANVAAAFGRGDARVAAVSGVQAAAILAASAALRAAAGGVAGSVATVVLTAALAPITAVGGGARLLQSNDQDPCIDFNNCTVAFVDPRIYTAASIANYHVILWTAVVLGFILLGVIYAMLGMDATKDPQLYAQVQDASVGAAVASSAAARAQ